MTCAICGAKDDLFAAVVQQPACSICSESNICEGYGIRDHSAQLIG